MSDASSGACAWEKWYTFKPGTVIEHVADEVAVITREGDILVLNESAGVVADCLKTGSSITSIAVEIAAKYAVDQKTAHEDVLDVLARLDKARVLIDTNPKSEHMPSDISRRNLISSIISFSGIFATTAQDAAKAFAAVDYAISQAPQGQYRIWRDSLGCEVAVPVSLSRVLPFGPYSQAILESVCPDMLVWAGSSGVHASARAMSFPEQMKFRGEDASGTRLVEWVAHADADLIVEIEPRLALLATANDAVWRSAMAPIARLIVAPGELASAYRLLGGLLQRQKAFDLADFVDCINGVFSQGKRALEGGEHKRVYYGHGRCGLDTLGKRSALNWVIESIGACNAAAELDCSKCKGLSLQEVKELQPDLVVLARNRDDVVETWKSWKDCPVRLIPDRPYPWLTGNQLTLQTLGALWLANAVYPEVYEYDIEGVAESCFRAFFNRAPSKTELLLLKQSI